MKDIIIGLSGALIGAVASIVATLMSLKQQGKQQREHDERILLKENGDWLRNRRFDLYIKIADVFNDIEMALYTDENLNVREVNTERYMEHLKNIKNLLNNNRGEIALLLPSKIQSEIYKLMNDIYKLENNNIDLDNAFNCVVKSKQICLLLQKDLEIN